jgi:hypothetical protein
MHLNRKGRHTIMCRLLIAALAVMEFARALSALAQPELTRDR